MDLVSCIDDTIAWLTRHCTSHHPSLTRNVLLSEKHAWSLLDLPLSRRCLQRFLRFRMGCHGLRRDIAAWAGIPRLHRFCNICQHRTIGDEKHLVFECPALQDLPDERPHLFEGAQADAMVLFMWQKDMISVVRLLIRAEKGSSTHLVSPEMAGKDAMNLSLSPSPFPGR